MASARTIRRYSAFLLGWAMAFGIHDEHRDEAHDLVWLFGEDRVGLMLTSKAKSFVEPLRPADPMRREFSCPASTVS